MFNFFTVKVGEGIQFNFTKLQEYVLSLPKGTYWIEIKKAKSERTLSQNNYLWAVVYPTVAESSGHTPAEIHDVFKRMFLTPRFIKYKDKEIKIPGSTARLTKVEFGEYIERVRAHVAEDGITIPDPK